MQLHRPIGPLVHALLLGALIAGLSACGGGGGGSGGNEAAGGETGSDDTSSPAAADDGAGRIAQGAITIDVLANDDFGADGPAASALAVTSAAAHGTAVVQTNGTDEQPSDDTITYTPNTGFSGKDQFSYRIEDEDGDAATANVTIHVGLAVSAGVEPRTLAFDWNASNEPDADRIDRFRLEVNADGASGFSPVEGAADLDGDGFETTVPVHLTDWVDALYRVVALDSGDTTVAASREVGLMNAVDAEDLIGYFKASNTDAGDYLGGPVGPQSVAVSADGETLAIGAGGESSGATGVNPGSAAQSRNDVRRAGAVYVFARDGSGSWAQQAYVKPSEVSEGAQFGRRVALSNDGEVLAVGTYLGGAVYMFERDAGWSQQAKILPPPGLNSLEGGIALSPDADHLAVGTEFNASLAPDLSGDFSDVYPDAGGVVVFAREADGSWSQEDYLTATHPTGFVDTTPNGLEGMDGFGKTVALGRDTLVVGVPYDDSSLGGTDADGSNSSDDGATDSGAAYVFRHDGVGAWNLESYLKAATPGGGSPSRCSNRGDHFGWSVAISDDGASIVVGAPDEDSAATGVITDGSGSNDDSAGDAGAAYLFTRDGSDNWHQDAYIKASNTGTIEIPEYLCSEFADGGFGRAVALSANGRRVAVGAPGEASAATGVSMDGSGESNDSALSAGAVYFFEQDALGAWDQTTYIKASNTEITEVDEISGGQSNERFGTALGLSADGRVLAVASDAEASGATGIGGDQSDNSADEAGALYLY